MQCHDVGGTCARAAGESGFAVIASPILMPLWGVSKLIGTTDTHPNPNPQLKQSVATDTT